MKKTMNNRIVDVLIFLACYLVVLVIGLLLGLERVAFGYILVYSSFFCALECIQLFFWSPKIQIVLFFVNVYIAYVLAAIYKTEVPLKDFVWKNIFTISLDEYIMMVSVSVIFSALGYIVLFIKSRRRSSLKQ